MINSTSERVPTNTAASVNEQIHTQTQRRLAFYAAHRDLIGERLEELDREWDIERMIETEAPTMTGLGMLMAAAFGRKWLVIPIFAQSMVLLHALQGWYPLLPMFRRMGFRTEREIAAERYALKALRGDFGDLGEGHQRADKAYEAAVPARMR